MPSVALSRYVVDPATDCWMWQGKVKPNGYGQARKYQPRRMMLAHRLFYEAHVGPIPNGLTVDHLCRVRLCVNPKHMDLVTRGENVARGVGVTAKNTAKTSCASGHPYSDDNTRLVKGRYGKTWRRCRECGRQRAREAYLPKKRKAK